MKKSTPLPLFALCLVLSLSTTALWAAPNEKQVKAMEVFLSNFTELGFMNISIEEMAEPANYPDLVRFGVGHNYINNFRSRVEILPEGKKRGDARIQAKWVEESVLKYFGLSIRADRSVEESDPPYFLEGKFFHFWASDGEAPWHARIKEASGPQKGLWELTGEIYNADAPGEILGDFRATIKEALWAEKPSYVLVTLATEYRE